MNESNREQLGNAARRATQLLAEAREVLLKEFPSVDLVLVLQTEGGTAVASGRPVEGREAAFLETARSLRMLRDAAEYCGRVLYQSPDPEMAAAHTHAIVFESRKAIAEWVKEKCAHPNCHVKEAAIYVATGVGILRDAGAPLDALADITAVTKEACRRAHLKILEHRARGSA